VIRITAPQPPESYIPQMDTLNKLLRSLWLQGPSVPCETVPKGAHLPWRIVLLGAPGVGKGTQADLLNQRLNACHLSTGDVFRAAAGRSDAEQSPAMQEALGYMRRGELVPDSTVWDLVRERSQCLHCAGGFILDGFPRTLAQAVSLKQLMDQEGLGLTAVVNYELPEAEIVARLGGRRTCELCKSVYHVTERPPREADHCDRCEGKLFQREDDRPESIKVRLEAYHRNTLPLIEFYSKAGLLMHVPATGTPDEICDRALPELESRRIRQFAHLMWSYEENRRD
jgi:adenylate kinase